MEKQYQKYFLGANSCEGFVSHFADSYKAPDGWRAIIIKGGPGTGKSSFMKFVAAKAEDRGYDVELCICSSDPNSLDGIIIKDIKTVILDGTAPHVVEPKYPAACEEILNLGDFWDRKKLKDSYQEIITVTDENKRLHKTVGRYLSACGQLMRDNLKLARGYTDTKKVYDFALKKAEKCIPKKKNGIAKEWPRFVGGVTPLGVVSYINSVIKPYKTKIVIEDKYGAVSSSAMSAIRKTALERGYEIITLKSPFLPSEMIDHILIPELSLAFVSENDYNSIEGDARRIHARRFADSAHQHKARSRMIFNRRVARELLITAVQTLQRAKTVHDKIEKYYVEAMDFEAIAKFAQEKINDILSD